MKKDKVVRFVVTSLIVVALGGALAINDLNIAGFSELGESGGMGVPQELADQVNSLNAGSGNPGSVETAEALTRQYYGATGVKGDFDHDGIPDNQQSSTNSSSSTTTQSSSSSTPKKAETKTEEKAEEEEPEEEPHVHEYTSEVTKEATCTEEGVTTYTCECGDSYTESIPALGHEEGEWETVTEPTCTEEGKKMLKCTRCGEVLKEEAIPAKGHVAGDWEVTKEADWINDGEQIKKCTVCGEVLETQVIPADHTPLYIIAGCVAGVIILIIAFVIAKKRKHGKK